MSVYRSHIAPSSFFWDTKLSQDRMQEIIDWIAQLPDDQRALLNDLLDDVREEATWNAEGEA